MHKVVWAPRAQLDLLAAEDYYDEAAPEFAWQLQQRLADAADLLAERPYAGPMLRRGPMRKWTVRRTLFVILYLVRADVVRILRVRHERSNWG